MSNSIIWIGMDVHASSINLAYAVDDGPIEHFGKICNSIESIRKTIKKLHKLGTDLHACYEAGPTGYVLHRQLKQLGVDCIVVAPSLIPKKPGDRVKTDKRDAKKLTQLYRAGLLTAVWIPDEAHEAFRELLRTRERAVKDRTRARNRLTKFLLVIGRRQPSNIKSWGSRHFLWLNKQQFEHKAHQSVFVDYLSEVTHQNERVLWLESELSSLLPSLDKKVQAVIHALQALRGIAVLSAATIVAEVGDLMRFPTASELMGYSGTVPSEHTTGQRQRKGRITKTGNAHLRRVIGEAAKQYSRRPGIGAPLKRRQKGLSKEVRDIAWKAQKRLHQRYRSLRNKGKEANKASIAVGRELLGFIWAIGRQVEAEKELQVA